MAGINTSIGIYDRMTPVIQNIISAVDSMASAFQVATADMKFDTSSFDTAKIEIGKASGILSTFGESIQDVDTQIQEVDNTFYDTVSSLNTLSNSITRTMSTASIKFADFGEYANTAKDAIASLVKEQEELYTMSSKRLGFSYASLKTDDFATSANILELNSKIAEIGATIESLPEIKLNTEGSTSFVNNLETSLQNVTKAQIELNNALNASDIVDINTKYENLKNTVADVEIAIKDFNNIWQTTNDFEMFTNTGIERFTNEIESAKASILELGTIQEEITSGFESLNIVPESELTKIANLQNRIASIGTTIENIPALDMNTEVANNSIEQIRKNLYNATTAQTALNTAIQNMDIATAQREYKNLNNVITQTEKYIRDNITTQASFTNEVAKTTAEIEKSNVAVGKLSGSVISLVGVYASLKSLKGAISLSDEYTQTTARLDLMNDGLYTTEELQNKIYKSAQNARTSYQTMADVVSKIGLRASDAFDTTDEIIQFSENISKMFVIAGASSQEIYSASLQLTQALGSGTLRGEELNAVLEAAPNIVEKIADYMGVAKGEIKTLASNGLVTSEIVRNAILVATDDINEQFESMPVTWSQVWSTTINKLYMALQPLLKGINALAQHWDMLAPIVGAVTCAIIAQVTAVGLLKAKNAILNTVLATKAARQAMVGAKTAASTVAITANTAAVAASTTAETANTTAETANTTAETANTAAVAANTVAEVANTTAKTLASAATVSATAAQWSYNAALYACPLTWIIIVIVAVIVVIYLAVAAWNKFTGDTVSGTGVIAGALAGLAALVLDVFIFIYNVVAVVIDTIMNFIITLAEFVANVWVDFAGSFKRLWYDLLDIVLNVCEKIADVIDTLLSPIFRLFGSDLDLSAKVAAKREEIAAKKAATYKDGIDYVTYDRWDNTIDYIDIGDWSAAGYNWGANLFSSGDDDEDETDWSSYFDDINDTLDDISEDTEDISDSLNDAVEELEYLRDYQAMKAINRNTISNVKIVMTNNNNLSKDSDIDGITHRLVASLKESFDIGADGVGVY